MAKLFKNLSFVKKTLFFKNGGGLLLILLIVSAVPFAIMLAPNIKLGTKLAHPISNSNMARIAEQCNDPSNPSCFVCTDARPLNGGSSTVNAGQRSCEVDGFWWLCNGNNDWTFTNVRCNGPITTTCAPCTGANPLNPNDPTSIACGQRSCEVDRHYWYCDNSQGRGVWRYGGNNDTCGGGGGGGGTTCSSPGQVCQSTNLPGSDFYHYCNDNPSLRSPRDCQIACDNDANCQSWTFQKDNSTCWLKNSKPAPVNDPNTTSGIKGFGSAASSTPSGTSCGGGGGGGQCTPCTGAQPLGGGPSTVACGQTSCEVDQKTWACDNVNGVGTWRNTGAACTGNGSCTGTGKLACGNTCYCKPGTSGCQSTLGACPSGKDWTCQNGTPVCTGGTGGNPSPVPTGSGGGGNPTPQPTSGGGGGGNPTPRPTVAINDGTPQPTSGGGNPTTQPTSGINPTSGVNPTSGINPTSGTTPGTATEKTIVAQFTLEGIGPSTLDGENNNPQQGPRALESEFTSSTGQKNTPQPVTVTYDQATGVFKGNIKANLLPGIYSLKIKYPSSLWKTIRNIELTTTNNYQATTVNFTSGDLNDDNILNLLDYNLMLDALKQTGSQVSSSNAQIRAAIPLAVYADLNLDNRVNELDLNIMLFEFKTRSGD